MTSYIFVVIGAVLVNNVVLVRILGLCPFMGVSKKLETAIGMGAATTFVLTVGSGTSLAANDGWETQSATATFTAAEVRELTTKAGAFTLPSGSRDASLLFTNTTNTSDTVLVSGAAGETGVALVDVYDVTGL